MCAIRERTAMIREKTLTVPPSASVPEAVVFDADVPSGVAGRYDVFALVVRQGAPRRPDWAGDAVVGLDIRRIGPLP
jgi:hypothetical protein